MKAVWNDAVLAESDDTVIVEGNHYFPPDSLIMSHLTKTTHTTRCGWKGVASYYTVNDGSGKTNANAAFVYENPKTAADNIKGHMAFWKGVKVV
mmetsp:Transcript_20936/g.27062  ORF Transcript_20936/g.27062 Transcript_20936/m.27062 type:complete len:94 (-) Transcript_20936:277-558(-)|eukprot:CAMPEP_0198147618 /NCGR_PEP_ID=MMETSP1443-20131203/36903_1 /TAXON_ID=186043 /ORGANISM="Entomoneis sp., Strain CCMP2396" /LENGTH=93 /DNA_ID=CAMNT_0043812027 /DNA_START=111 /DNA_END=392 /DNA_ORIENTATION=-